MCEKHKQKRANRSRYLIISTPQPLLMKRMMRRRRRRSLSRGSPDRALRRVVCRPGGWLELEKQPIYTYSRGISLALRHHRVGFVLDSVSLSFAACGEGASSRSEQVAEKISSRPPSVTCAAVCRQADFSRPCVGPDGRRRVLLLPDSGCCWLVRSSRVARRASSKQTKIALLFSFRYKSDDYSDLNIIQLSTSVRFISF